MTKIPETAADDGKTMILGKDFCLKECDANHKCTNENILVCHDKGCQFPYAVPITQPVKEGKYMCSECDTLYDCIETGCPHCNQVKSSQPVKESGRETIVMVKFPEHGKIVLTNQRGDTYTSKSEELIDFFHGATPKESGNEAMDDDEGWIYCPNCGRVKAEQ